MSEQKGAQKSKRRTNESILNDEQLDEMNGGAGDNTQASLAISPDILNTIPDSEQSLKDVYKHPSEITDCWPRPEPKPNQQKQ